jgi:hypothetical protein
VQFFLSSYALFSKHKGALSELPCKGFLSNPIAVIVVGGGGFARPSSGGAKESYEKHDPAENKTRHLSNTSFEH